MQSAAGALATRMLTEQLSLRPDEAMALCHEAEELAAAGTDVRAVFVSLAITGLIGVRAGIEGSFERMEQALTLARDEPSIGTELPLALLAALVALGITRPQDVRPLLADHRTVPEDDPMAAQAAWLRGCADAWTGDVPRSIGNLTEAVRMSSGRDPVTCGLSHMLLGKALTLHGDIVEARRHLVTSRELAAAGDGFELGNGHLECSVYLHLVTGDDEGFVAVLELLATPGRGRLSGLAPAYRLELATALATRGDRVRAGELVADLLEPTFAGRPVPPLLRAWAAWVVDPQSLSAQHELADLAIAAADPPLRLEAVRAAWVLGTSAAAQGRRQDALRLLESAAERATAMGVLGYVRRLAAEIGALDTTDGNGHRAAPASSFDAVLTPAELRVAKAVVGGLSNREVAELLFLSERTVETHLSSIFRKIGVRNRTQLAVRL